jgi:hypothetical protein
MQKLTISLGVLCFTICLARGSTLYSDLPVPLPPNAPSLGYAANSTAEFGGIVGFAGGSPFALDSVTVAMSNWAYESEWETLGASAGYSIPLTLNLYGVGPGGTVGSPIATETVNAFIPWRPQPDPADCASNAYRASNGVCYTGSLSTVTFTFSSLSVPSQIIYGLAYNTTDAGYRPTGVLGPYEELNYALASTGALVGSDRLPGTAYWNTTNAGDYADGGAAGVGVFRQDQNWSPYTGAIEFDGTAGPEPGTLALMAAGLVAVSLRARRRGVRSKTPAARPPALRLSRRYWSHTVIGGETATPTANCTATGPEGTKPPGMTASTCSKPAKFGASPA